MNPDNSPDRITDNQKWGLLKRSKTLREDVQDLDDYTERTARGLSLAIFQLAGSEGMQPSELALQAHETAFSSVDEAAGRFRLKPGVFGGYIPADPHRVDREMELFDAQSKSLHESAETDLDKLQAVAFDHARFIRIHPFEDGNGRVGRLLLDDNICKTFDVNSRICEFAQDDKPAYIAALKSTFVDRDLAPLTSYLSKGLQEYHPELDPIDVPDSMPLPYNLHPDLTVGLYDDPSFEEDFNKSKNREHAIHLADSSDPVLESKRKSIGLEM